MIFGNLRKDRICFLFLRQGLTKNIRRFMVAQRFCYRDQAAISSYFIVFSFLSGEDQPHIPLGCAIVCVVYNIFPLLNNTGLGVAFGGICFFSDHAKNLLQAIYMILRLNTM